MKDDALEIECDWERAFRELKAELKNARHSADVHDQHPFDSLEERMQAAQDELDRYKSSGKARSDFERGFQLGWHDLQKELRRLTVE